MKLFIHGLFAAAAFGLVSVVRAETPTDPAAAPPGPVEFFNGVHSRFVIPKPAPSESGDPLAAITGEMGDVTHDLGARKTGEPTQVKQKQVVSQLDEIITELEKQCKGGSGVSAHPTKPMQDSKIAKGPGGMGELVKPGGEQRTIANLPTKERDRILQSKTEGFPPGYESMLSSYYTRLAQEKVNDDSADRSAAPTTRPAVVR